MTALLRLPLSVLLAVILWAAAALSAYGLAAFLGWTQGLADLAAKPSQPVVDSLNDLDAALRSQGWTWLSAHVSAVAKRLSDNRELYWLIWSAPSIFFLSRLKPIREVSAFITKGPPPYLNFSGRLRRRGRDVLKRSLETSSVGTVLDRLAAFAGAPQRIAVDGLFGPSEQARQDIALAWLAGLERQKWFVGRVDQLPSDLILRRDTAMLLRSSSQNGDDLRELRQWLSEVDPAANARYKLRVLVSSETDLTHSLIDEQDPLGRLYSEFVQREEAQNSPRTPGDFRATVLQDMASDRSAGGLVESTSLAHDQRARDAKAPFIFAFVSDSDADGPSSDIWREAETRSLIGRATRLFGADGWRILVAGALLSPAPTGLVTDLLPATANVSKLRALYFGIDGADDVGRWIPGLGLDGAGMLLRCLIERDGAREISRYIGLLADRSPDRLAPMIAQLAPPEDVMVPPPEIARFYPELGDPTLGEAGDIHPVIRAAFAEVGHIAGLAHTEGWVPLTQALLGHALKPLSAGQRRELLLAAASWESERGLKLELELLAGSDLWLAKTEIVCAFADFLYQHLWRKLPGALADLTGEGETPELWADRAVDDDGRDLLWTFDILDVFLRGRVDDAFLKLWPEHEVRLVGLLARDDMLALGAAWALFWAADCSDIAEPQVPFSDATQHALIQLCARIDAQPAVWRRCCEVLQKIASPVAEGEPIYEWAKFADGVDAPPVRPRYVAVPADKLVPALQEARTRLSDSEAVVRTAAALLLSLYDHTMPAVAQELGSAIQQPGIRYGREDLLTLRLAQLSRNLARPVLGRLMVEGLNSRTRAFLALCGLRDLATLSWSVALIHPREDDGFSTTAIRWSAATRKPLAMETAPVAVTPDVP